MKFKTVTFAVVLSAISAFAADGVAKTQEAAPVVKNTGKADSTKAADNTKVNERDRQGETVTPMNQGNSAQDTEITAAIRRAVMGEKNLSFNAKNAKVITIDRKVTLRGPVASADEKASLESIARKVAGVSSVESQLEIKQ